MQRTRSGRSFSFSAICLLGLIIALPNLFYGRVERANDARLAAEKGQTLTPEMLADAAAWPAWLPHGLVNLGLDLRGGAHVLVQVQTQDVHAEQLEGLWPSIRDKLRDLRDQVGSVRRLDSGPEELRIRIGNPAGMDAALKAAQDAAQPVFSITGASAPRVRGAGRGRPAGGDADRRAEGGARRADAAAEPRDHPPPRRRDRHPRAVDPAPGQRPHPGAGAGDRLGGGAPADHRQDRAAVVPCGGEPLDGPQRPAGARPGWSCRRWTSPASSTCSRSAPVVTGEQLDDSQPSFDQNGRPAVTFRFNPTGRCCVRRVYRAEHRQAVRDRARQPGDLGAGDPGAYRRRLGDHHRQLHRRGVDAARDPAARRRAAGGDQGARAADRSVRSSARTRSTPGGCRPLVAFVASSAS